MNGERTRENDAWDNGATTDVDQKAARGVQTRARIVTAVPLHGSNAAADRAGRAGPPRLTLLPALPPAPVDRGDPNPGDLVRAAARAESLAWPRLVRRFSGLVRGVARSHGFNDADVADVSQVVWLALARHLDQLRDADRVAGWLATTTRYECVRVLRQRQRAKPTSEMDILDRVEESDRDAELIRQEQVELLRGVIRTLARHQRRLLEMLLRDPQPSYKEMSDALGIPIGSIGPTRQRCLAVLRRKCISAGIEPVPA